MQKLKTAITWRYAVKKFDATKQIPQENWALMEDALIATPSSYGLQPWKFLIIDDPAIRSKLRSASWNQSQVTDASQFVVFAHRIHLDENYINKYIKCIADTRGISVDSLEGFRKVMMGDVLHGPRSKIIPEWSARQVYIALGNFMTAASLLGIDTCPMEGLDSIKYDEILNLGNTEYRTVVACAAGYRHDEDKLAIAKKVRFLKDELISHY